MQISKVEVINFRNLKHNVYDLPDGTTIITGKNELGKSNLLNAINYIVASCLLTDKFGSGENDLDSIVPIDHSKGEHTEVSIWLKDENNQDCGKYTKRLKTSFDMKTGKITGHDTQYLINDIAKGYTKTSFYEELYKRLKYEPAFKTLKTNEVRLYTDPLYALLKLDQKELRQTLVAMGCSVTNEELYQAGFEDMRKYENKYLGNWSNMRKNYKDIVTDNKESIKAIESQLELYNDIEAVDKEEIENLKAKRDEAISKKNEYLKPASNPYEIELAKVRGQLKEELDKIRNEHQLLITEYNEKLKNKKLELQYAKDKALNILNAKVSDVKMQYNQANTDLANLNLKIGALVNEIEGLNSSINYIQKNIDERSKELAEENEKHYDGETCTCPMCFYEFQDQAKIDAFATIKFENIKRLTGIIAQAQNEKGNLEKKKQEKVEAKINLENDRTAKQDGINRLTELLNSAVEEVRTASENYHNETLEADINVLRAFLIENEGIHLEALKSAYAKDLEAQIECLEAKANQDFNKIDHTSEIEALNTQIMALDDEIKQLYIAEEKFDTKQSLQKRLETLTTEFNDNSNVLARCVDMIHTFISKVNQKAKELTGLDFVMLEENLSNDNLTECCYALVDGVPFKDLNTSKKITTGIKFIERIRQIGNPKCDLPILADRLESIDSIEKIKSLTHYQLIGTRVSNEAEITLK